MRTPRLILFVGALTALISLAGVAVAGSAASKAKPQGTCPVTGKPIDKKVSTVYQGQKVYFCCPNCIATFGKDPEIYLAKLGELGQIVESQQSLCPVTGDPIDPKVSVDYRGRRVFFCCRMCIKDFQADPAKFLPLLGRTQAPAGAGMHQGQAAPPSDQQKGRNDSTKTSKGSPS